MFFGFNIMKCLTNKIQLHAKPNLLFLFDLLVTPFTSCTLPFVGISVITLLDSEHVQRDVRLVFRGSDSPGPNGPRV